MKYCAVESEVLGGPVGMLSPATFGRGIGGAGDVAETQ